MAKGIGVDLRGGSVRRKSRELSMTRWLDTVRVDMAEREQSGEKVYD